MFEEEEKNEWNVKKRKKNWDCENISTLLCSYFAIENGVYSLFTYGINKNLSLKHFFGIFCAFSWYNHAWMPVNTWIEHKKEFFNMNLVVVLVVDKVYNWGEPQKAHLNEILHGKWTNKQNFKETISNYRKKVKFLRKLPAWDFQRCHGESSCFLLWKICDFSSLFSWFQRKKTVNNFLLSS